MSLPLFTSTEGLKLRRLEIDRAAMCQVIGIVDDESADLPLFVANMMAKQRRWEHLLRQVATELRSPTQRLDDVIAQIGTEVGP